jgi:hypothetical protein
VITRWLNISTPGQTVNELSRLRLGDATLGFHPSSPTDCPASPHKRLDPEVIAVGADGDGAALAGREDLRARGSPARDDRGVRVAVRRVLPDGDDGDGRARGRDEAFGRGGAEVFIDQTFAQYSCVCIT